MYHRYMPTENGSFQRKNMPERQAQELVKQVPPCEEKRQEVPQKPEQPAKREQLPIAGKLLSGMDSGDLLVLLLLLFLLSEGNEDSSEIIMTLAIFLFMQ